MTPPSYHTLVMIIKMTPTGYSIGPYWPVRGEVIAVNLYNPGIQNLLLDKWLVKVDAQTPLFLHEPTGRHFADSQALAAYAHDYERQESRARCPHHYEPVPRWRMTHSVRVLPDGIDLQQGEILPPTHPAFPLLYANYSVSPHPLMVPALVSDASPPGVLADTPPGHLVREQRPYLSAAFKLQREVHPDGTMQLCPAFSPFVQAADMETVKTLLRTPPWETVYQLGRDTLPPQVPDISKLVPRNGALIVVVRVRDPGRNFPRELPYEYFQVQSIELPVPAIPIAETAEDIPQTPSKMSRGRPLDAEWRTWSLEHLIDLVSEGRRRARRQISEPSIDDIAEKTSYSRRTLNRAAKPHGYTLTTLLPLLSD